MPTHLRTDTQTLGLGLVARSSVHVIGWRNVVQGCVWGSADWGIGLLSNMQCVGYDSVQGTDKRILCCRNQSFIDFRSVATNSLSLSIGNNNRKGSCHETQPCPDLAAFDGYSVFNVQIYFHCEKSRSPTHTPLHIYVELEIASKALTLQSGHVNRQFS